MPKGRVLTPEEREEIARMHDAGASGREIAKKIARSKTVVLNFLKNPAQYAQTKRSGRKRALSSDDERRLYAALFQRHSDAERDADDSATALTGDASGAVDPAQGVQQRAALPPSHQIKKSAEQIRKEFNVPLSTRRVQQLLSEWRRQARKAQDNQQQLVAAGDVVTDQGSEERDINSSSSKNRQSGDGHDGPESAANPGQMETFSEGPGATTEGDMERQDLQHADTTTQVVGEEALADGNITSSKAAESPRRSAETTVSPSALPASMEI